MPMDVARAGREGAAAVIEALNAWMPRHGPVLGLHPGDVGWHLRHDDDTIAGSLALIRDAGDPVAVALVEPGSAVVRPVIRPDRWDDPDLACVLADLVDEVAASADDDAYTDAPSHAAYRAELAARGWQLDPDPWVVLHKPLTSADSAHADGQTSTLQAESDIADRVAVQFGAFTRSTFTVARWHQMASGPQYDRRLDLLRRDGEGTPVSAGTGWLAGPGRAAILEPVGTHRDHVGAGHGRAVVAAIVAALARAGASSVNVQTPLSNPTAIRAYEACGLRPVEQLHAMTRRAEPSRAN